MTHPIESNKCRKYPFVNLRIADNQVLNTIEGRSPCTKCTKSRKFFCYTCNIPVEALKSRLPIVHAPVKIDIIKHKHEIDGKSTAIHAAVLCDNVTIYSYPDIPDYSAEENVVLIYPEANSVPVSHFFDANVHLVTSNNFGLPKGHNMGTLLRMRMQETNTPSPSSNDDLKRSDSQSQSTYSLQDLPIKRAVFIDSTWNQSRSIYKDTRISSLKSVVIQNRLSQFWRHQKGSPRWYLATIEAIHQFLLEVHLNAWGLNGNYKGLETLEICNNFYKDVQIFQEQDESDMSPTAPYNGHYDNLLFFFSHMYDLIHMHYDHDKLKSYKRPI